MPGFSNRKREVTVADVAREAGVGKATASRVLGGYGSASERARNQVLAAAAELGYRPNEVARSMNTGRSKTIGLVVGDIENGYFGLAARGVSDALKGSGYGVVLANTSERVDAEIEAVKVLLDKRVDGLIVSPASAFVTQHLQDVYNSGRPLVLLDRRLDALPVPSVRVNISPAAFRATAALLDAGHTRIAFLSSLMSDGPGYSGLELSVSSVTDRLSGIVRALKSRGMLPDPHLIRYRAEGAVRTKSIIRELLALDSPPTALIASDSKIALDILLALREFGVAVPDAISLIAFDNFDWSPLINPSLTVVAQPTYEVGRLAAEVLLRVLQGEDQANEVPPLTAELIVRDSIGPAPIAQVQPAQVPSQVVGWSADDGHVELPVTLQP